MENMTDVTAADPAPGSSISALLAGMVAPPMHVYSGNCRLCDVGVGTGFKDLGGKPLNTGDIVVTFTENDLGVQYLGGLTVVVSDQYQSYSDGTHRLKDGEPEFFVMGIRSVDLDEAGAWKVQKLKGFESVVAGENWPDYGFRFAVAAEDHGTGDRTDSNRS